MGQTAGKRRLSLSAADATTRRLPCWPTRVTGPQAAHESIPDGEVTHSLTSLAGDRPLALRFAFYTFLFHRSRIANSICVVTGIPRSPESLSVHRAILGRVGARSYPSDSPYPPYCIDAAIRCQLCAMCNREQRCFDASAYRQSMDIKIPRPTIRIPSATPRHSTISSWPRLAIRAPDPASAHPYRRIIIPTCPTSARSAPVSSCVSMGFRVQVYARFVTWSKEIATNTQRNTAMKPFNESRPLSKSP